MSNEVTKHIEKDLKQLDKSSFAHVLYMAVFAIVVIVLFAIFVIAWRSKKQHKPPYTQSPVSRLTAPAYVPDAGRWS